MSKRTRIERKPRAPEPRSPLRFEERVALFIGTVHRERAASLLEGMTDPMRLRATVFLEQLKQAASAQRQAQLAHVFGVRPDALECLQDLLRSTEGELRSAVLAALTPTVRQQLATPAPPATEHAPATRALACRLVREASRASLRLDGQSIASR